MLESRVDARKPLVRHLTPLLRPLLAWNHRWAMGGGLERITAALDTEPRSAAERIEARAEALPPVR